MLQKWSGSYKVQKNIVKGGLRLWVLNYTGNLYTRHSFLWCFTTDQYYHQYYHQHFFLMYCVCLYCLPTIWSNSGLLICASLMLTVSSCLTSPKRKPSYKHMYILLKRWQSNLMLIWNKDIKYRETKDFLELFIALNEHIKPILNAATLRYSTLFLTVTEQVLCQY